jgi:hypothetical protein
VGNWSLAVFAVGAVSLALQRFLGIAGIDVTVLLFVILGNPRPWLVLAAWVFAGMARLLLGSMIHERRDTDAAESPAV